MTATDVLDELASLGVTATAAGQKLLLTPGSKVPQDLLVEVKEHKNELLELVNQPSDSSKGTISVLSEISPPRTDAFSDHLLSRLQAGSRWLTAQHQAWLDKKQGAASDERFSVALDAWAEMERSLRLVYDYQGCIFGPDQRCPEDAPVRCDGCLG